MAKLLATHLWAGVWSAGCLGLWRGCSFLPLLSLFPSTTRHCAGNTALNQIDIVLCPYSTSILVRGTPYRNKIISEYDNGCVGRKPDDERLTGGRTP